jgi:hypothetical protein
MIILSKKLYAQLLKYLVLNVLQKYLYLKN